MFYPIFTSIYHEKNTSAVLVPLRHRFMGIRIETTPCGKNRILFCLILVTGLFISVVHAEGTKEMIPFAGGQGALEINKYRNDFGFYDAHPDYRICISIRSTFERIRFGFGKVMDLLWWSYPGDMTYRIKDPSGNVVYGPFSVPTWGKTGYIATYDQAVTGPFPGGYPYLEMMPQTTGNFYIEFFYPPGEGYSENNQHSFKYFDITVVNAAKEPVKGRVWSKAWQFWCLDAEFPPSTHRCYGSLMILSDDSIVTKVSLHGLIGGAFSVSSNATGCENTGNYKADRQSRTGAHTYPKYKIFFNDPDTNLFPTSKGNTGIIPPVLATAVCDSGVDFSIKVSHDGYAEVLIELDPNPGEDPEDVKILAMIKANPGPGGYNMVHWDGRDKNGIPVATGKLLTATITSVGGITHLPLHDIEFNDTGFVVSQVRPPGDRIRLFWDDSQVPGGTTDTVTGCLSGIGCHTWNNTVGDLNTINSWWYVTRNPSPPVSFALRKSPGPTGAISGPDVLCAMDGIRTYSVDPILNPKAQSYTWSYSGSNVTITGSDTVVHLVFTPSSTSGILSVSAYDSICGDGPASTLELAIDTTPPEVELRVDSVICSSSCPLQLTGGTPPGGEYAVDGMISDTLETDQDSAGMHLVTYSYTEPSGCSAIDSAWVRIKNCTIESFAVWFPNAFNPDGDGANDRFRPVVADPTILASFRIQIFNRYGQLICQTDDPVAGWDGTLKGSPCPCDVYVWMAEYKIAGQPGSGFSQKGAVTLIR